MDRKFSEGMKYKTTLGSFIEKSTMDVKRASKKHDLKQVIFDNAQLRSDE